MSIWSKLFGGLRALFLRRVAEQEMDEELRAFLHASAERKMQAGMSASEAERAARVEMGSVESVKEAIRAVGWEGAVEALWTDVRYSVRILAKAPLFTSMVMLTLALGIGANTAIFSLMNSLLLKALPVEKPEELMEVSGSGRMGNSGDYVLTNPLWEQIRDRQDVFSGVFAWDSEQFNLAKGGMTQNADGLWVSGDFFRTLGLHPAAGRLLSAADDRRGCAALAVLSYGFWKSRFDAAGSAVGGAITLDGHPFEVIGVAPAGFYGMTVGRKFDIAVPICTTEVFDGPKSRLDKRHWWWLHVAGRIRKGIGMARLKSRLAGLSPAVYGSAVPGDWISEWQDNFRKRVMVPIPLTTGLSDLRKDYEEPLRVLMAVVGLVLLIACANIASLMMARAAARSTEMAMRLALGASRLHLMRQLITECLLLSFAGAALGLLLARWGDTLLLNYLSGVHQQVFLDFALDAHVLIFTAGVATITGLLFGVAPALRGTVVSLSSAVKENHTAARAPRTRLRLWIVASQVALSLVLLVTAGLLLRSFFNLATSDVGFDPEHLLLVNVNLFTAKTPTSEYTATYDRIGEQLRALPGVVSAARSMLTPLGNSQWNSSIHSDVPHPVVGDGNLVYFNFVDRYYFATLRTPLLAGRDFNSSDSPTSQPVAVINQTLARRFFPGVNPVGHTFRPEGARRKLLPPVEVIGLTRDARYESMNEEPVPTVFCPLAQTPLEDPADSFEIRSALPQRAITKSIERAVAAINPEIPIEIHTLTAQVDESMARERVLAVLSAFFGGLALLLATIGVYGTLSYLVTQRHVEFGIRMALGATSRSILTLLMRNVVTLLIGGILTGIGLSLATSRLLSALLFGIDARDPQTIAMSGALIAAVSLAAGLLAARRATRVDPMVALREQ